MLKRAVLNAKINKVLNTKSIWMQVLMATVDATLKPRMRFITPIFRKGNTFYFATSRKSRKVRQIMENNKVQLLFNRQLTEIVLASGKCTIIDNLKKKKYLWKRCWYNLKEHFKGVESPDFCILKVKLTRAEYTSLKPKWIEQTLKM